MCMKETMGNPNKALTVRMLLQVFIFIRTDLEDRNLQSELPGYKEYAHRTRYRLLPGVW